MANCARGLNNNWPQKSGTIHVFWFLIETGMKGLKIPQMASLGFFEKNPHLPPQSGCISVCHAPGPSLPSCSGMILDIEAYSWDPPATYCKVLTETHLFATYEGEPR